MHNLTAWILALASFLPATAAAQCLYQVDNGNIMGSLGVGDRNFHIALNGYTVTAGQSTIEAVEVCWGPSLYHEQPVTPAIWSDPNQDGNPADGQLLKIGPTTPSILDCQLLPLETPVDVGPDGTRFFVGVFYRTAPATSLSIRSNGGRTSSWNHIGQGEPDPSDLTEAGAPSRALGRTFAIRGICSEPIATRVVRWGTAKALFEPN